MSHVLGYLYADYAAMVAVLGEPSPEDISDPDKIDAEWNAHIDGCVPVNVYSYHDVQPDHRHAPVTQPGMIVEWHVQAPSPAAFEALSQQVFGENGYTITRAERWPGDTTGQLEARASHEADCHGDATLDVIALVEALLKDDDHGYHVLLDGMLGDGNVSHVVGTLAGALSAELVEHYGAAGALEMLAHQRGHELGSHQRDKAAGPELPEPGDLTEAEAISDGLEDLGAIMVQNGDELRALTRAVERLGDILDKQLAWRPTFPQVR